MKWYSTESTQGNEDYSVVDDMLGVHQTTPNPRPRPQRAVGRPKIPALLGEISLWRATHVLGLRQEAELHHGQLWNSNASATFYNWAFGADPNTTMFLNEYNTVENPGDRLATPAQYLKKLREIQSFPGNAQEMLGIGLEAHFNSFMNLAYLRSSIDVLAATGLPVWITELDVQSSPNHNQAMYLEQSLREVAWRPQGCWRMCLTDTNFKNLPIGDVIDKLMAE
ncbi:1,4-alpha-glucan-branching enzyme [Trema orientale]|uniref:1,4-alpha-glucan-branching enzyme n=1 Tax=Trema orientale TaxID=63057 RepID=A0A2P5EYD1_TREOI|nr:1,4-alpha-glucan-branching enzyme [Trema orientale]